jgi:cobalt-zinc-cadmium efflux system protein
MIKAQKLLWIIAFNLIIIVMEVGFGLFAHSFALIADALHNAGDVIAIVITYIALNIGSRQITFQYTFGFIKAEMMAAFVNTLFLFMTMLYMIYESIFRFFSPETIAAEYMIGVGLVAVLANGISAYMLKNLGVSTCASGHVHEHGDVNIYSAYLHMLSDALISLGVVAAGIVIYLFGIYSLDAALTIVFSLYILVHTYPLLKSSFLSLMDANTHTLSEQRLSDIIQVNTHVVSYHDLHMTQPSSKHTFISFHIVLDDERLSLKEIDAIVSDIKRSLKEHGFTHIIIQAESKRMLEQHKHCSLMR